MTPGTVIKLCSTEMFRRITGLDRTGLAHKTAASPIIIRPIHNSFHPSITNCLGPLTLMSSPWNWLDDQAHSLSYHIYIYIYIYIVYTSYTTWSRNNDYSLRQKNDSNEREKEDVVAAIGTKTLAFHQWHGALNVYYGWWPHRQAPASVILVMCHYIRIINYMTIHGENVLYEIRSCLAKPDFNCNTAYSTRRQEAPWTIHRQVHGCFKNIFIQVAHNTATHTDTTVNERDLRSLTYEQFQLTSASWIHMLIIYLLNISYNAIYSMYISLSIAILQYCEFMIIYTHTYKPTYIHT